MAKPKRKRPLRHLTHKETMRVVIDLAKAQADVKRLRQSVGELMHLIGSAIEALEFFDSDDGHAELIRAGIVAEYTRITEKIECRPAFAK